MATLNLTDIALLVELVIRNNQDAVVAEVHKRFPTNLVGGVTWTSVKSHLLKFLRGGYDIRPFLLVPYNPDGDPWSVDAIRDNLPDAYEGEGTESKWNRIMKAVEKIEPISFMGSQANLYSPDNTNTEELSTGWELLHENVKEPDVLAPPKEQTPASWMQTKKGKEVMTMVAVLLFIVLVIAISRS
jgi:hypothetical protein